MSGDIGQALEKAQAWMDADGVIAVGQGDQDGTPTVDVWVLPDNPRDFPVSLDGFPVRVRDSGGPVDALGGA